MTKISNFIVKFRYLFLVLTFTALIVSLTLLPLVKTNYDATVYLPDNLETKKALKVMIEEFGEMGQAMIMIEDISITKALIIKKTIIEQTEGVLDILWLDSFVDDELLLKVDDNIFQKPELSEIVDNIPGVNQFYKNKKALFQVIFDKSDYDDITDKAIVSIRKYLDKTGYQYAMAGTAVSTFNARHATESEIYKITIIVIPIFLIILVIFTESFFEPFLFITVVGVAVLINMGTNAIFKEISFFTQSTATLLQFAVSMDYSIFLLHRYNEEKKRTKDKKEALKNALSKSFTPIMASSLTTIAGFASLMFMRYTIGMDMALVMIKGIVLSILSVFILMPALILIFDKWIERTKHRSFAPKLKKVADSSYKWRFIIPIIILFLIYPAYSYQSSNDFIYGTSSMESGDGTPASDEIIRIAQEFGNSNIVVLLVPHEKTEDNVIDEVKTKEKEKLLLNDIKTKLENKKIKCSIQSYYQLTDLSSFFPMINFPKDPQIEEIKQKINAWLEDLGYGDPSTWINSTLIPEGMKSQLISENYSRIIISLNTISESFEAFEAVDTIRSSADLLIYNNYYILGTTSSVQEIKAVVEEDFIKVNIISIIAILIILMISFKSFVIPFILVFVIELSIWLNMSIPNLMGDPLIFIGYMLVSSIQLGATIDYGILLTGRYLESRKKNNKKRAMLRSIIDSGNSIFTSALIMGAAGFALAFSSSIEGVSSIGSLIGRGAFLSAFLVLIFLPQLLYFLDTWILKGTIGLTFYEPKNNKKPKTTVVDEEKELLIDEENVENENIEP